MKRKILTLLLLIAATPLAAQLYHPGERLDYRVSYRAKMFPNTEIGAVEVSTVEESHDGTNCYKVVGAGRTLPTYRWFFNVEDIYTVWVDPQTLRPMAFNSSIREGDYTFRSDYVYDWEHSEIRTRWQSRQRPEKHKTCRSRRTAWIPSRSSSRCARPTSQASAKGSPPRCRWCSRIRSAT